MEALLTAFNQRLTRDRALQLYHHQLGEERPQSIRLIHHVPQHQLVTRHRRKKRDNRLHDH